MYKLQLSDCLQSDIKEARELLPEYRIPRLLRIRDGGRQATTTQHSLRQSLERWSPSFEAS